jgi:hypothetical protein
VYQIPGRVKYKSVSDKQEAVSDAHANYRMRSTFSFRSFTWLLGRWYAPANGEVDWTNR